MLGRQRDPLPWNATGNWGEMSPLALRSEGWTGNPEGNRMSGLWDLGPRCLALKAGSATLGKLLPLSGLQVPHLYNENSNNSPHPRTVLGTVELILATPQNRA